jgi:hypothetical protein
LVVAEAFAIRAATQREAGVDVALAAAERAAPEPALHPAPSTDPAPGLDRNHRPLKISVHPRESHHCRSMLSHFAM